MMDEPLGAPRERTTTASLELLYQISRELTSRLELPDLLQRILQITTENVGAVNASILALDEEGNVLEGALIYNGRPVLHTAQQLKATLARGLAGWVIRQRRGALIHNTEQDERWLRRPDDTDILGAKSALCVPLLARVQAVGVLTLVHPEPGHFHPNDLDVVTAIADVAGIAVENARLFTAEQNRRQLADTLQEIARSISASLDPKQVLPLALNQLERLIAYDTASVLLVEGESLRVVAAHGFSDPAQIVGRTFESESAGAFQRVLNERRPLVLADVQLEPHWSPPDLPELQASHGWIGAPLIVKDEVVGLIAVNSRQVSAYDETDAQQLAAFADQAATAVNNARLFSDSQRQMQAMTALAETSRSISSTLDLNEVLARILSRIRSLLRVEAASIALVENGTGTLEFKLAEGEVAQSIVGLRLKLGQGIAGWVAQSGRPVMVPEVRGDPRFYPDVDKQTGFTTRAIACAPIQGQNRTLGVIEVMNPESGSFDRESLQLLSSVAGLAGTAILHAQLFAETQAAEQRYAGLFEDSIDSILITDLSGLITDANRRACQFLGYSREELVGLKVDTIHRMGTGVFGHDRFRGLTAGKPKAFETTATAKDGRTLPVEVHVKRINRRGQEFVQWIVRDISERAALDELRNDLTAMIFHDLHAPLGNIISSLDVLQSAMPQDDEALQSVLAIAQRGSQRLSRLVDSLLDVSRLESGKAILHKEQASVNALVAEAAEAVLPAAEDKGITLHFHLSPRLPFVNIDPDMIRRVIINLMDNAVKYTPNGGRITVTAKAGAKELLLSVSDTGPGIPTDQQSAIFDKFARVHREGGPKGLGLGLAFCRLAVQAHHGRIWVDSEPEKGAKFSFTLPL